MAEHDQFSANRPSDSALQALDSNAAQDEQERATLKISFVEKLSTYFVGPLAAILVYVYQVAWQRSQGEVPLLLAILFGYVAHQLVYMFHEYRVERVNRANQRLQAARSEAGAQRIVHSYEELQHKLNTSFNVQYISGDAIEVCNRVAASLASAKYVRNTCVHLTEVLGPHSNVYRKIIQMYDVFLRREDAVEWHDLVATEDFVGGRFDEILTEGPVKITCKQTTACLYNRGSVRTSFTELLDDG